MSNTFSSLADLRPDKSRLNLSQFKEHEQLKALLAHREKLQKALKEEAYKNSEEYKDIDGEELAKALFANTPSRDLEKGLISDLSYSMGSDGKGLSFTKSGKELKKQLPALIIAMNAKLAVIKSSMDDLEKTIGEAPDEEYSDYISDGTTMPAVKKYCYSKISSWDDVSQKYNESSKEQKAMDEYNRLVYKYCDLYRDIQVADVLSRNLDENKKYTLTLRQLTYLGF